MRASKLHSDDAYEALVEGNAAMFSAQTDIRTQGSSISSSTKKRDRSTKIDGIPKQAVFNSG